MILPLLAAVAIAVFVDVQGYFQILIWGCVFVAVYCLNMWLFGMNRYERELVSRPLARIFGKLSRR